MSPEQRSGVKVDGRSDLYSLGIMLYQFVTGEMPTEEEIFTDWASKPGWNWPGLPKSVENIIKKSLAFAPGGRFKSGEQMAVALRRAADGLTDADLARFAPPQSVISLAAWVEDSDWSWQPGPITDMGLL